MKRFVFAIALLLAACNTVGPYYEKSNYATPAAQTRLNFEEAKVVCRARNLKYHWMGDTQDLDIPRYTECMQEQGYIFSKQ